MPQVTFVDLENGEYQIIADSFEVFLQTLVLKTEDMWVICSDKKLSELVIIFQSLFPVEIESFDKEAYGYESYRLMFEQDDVFLEPNLVPYAFARPNEGEYADLLLYDGQIAQRYPEIPAEYSLLNIYEPELADHLIEKLRGVLEIVPLETFLDKQTR